MGHAQGLVGPQRPQRYRGQLAGQGRSQRRQRLLGRLLGLHRPQQRQRVDLLDRRRRPRVRPRHRPVHPGRRQQRERPGRGHRRHLRRTHRGLRQPALPVRQPGLHRRRDDQPGRPRPDPQHGQPLARQRRPELLLLLDPEHRGARGRRPAEPLVLPARRGLQPGRRQAHQPDLQQLRGHRRRHQGRGPGLLRRHAAQDQRHDLQEVPDHHPDRRQEPRPLLQPVQPHQGGLGRGQRARPDR